MPQDPDQPVVLTLASNEAEAAIIVAALEEQGFRAEMAGQLTAGFRAEAPGGVKVLVRRADLEGARAALEELHEQADDFADDDE
jgi:hypothetical protein